MYQQPTSSFDHILARQGRPARRYANSTTSNKSSPSDQATIPSRPTQHVAGGAVLPGMSEPWAPFQSLSDFEWFETVYDLHPDRIKKQLKGMHSHWSTEGTNISFKTFDDVQFQKDKVRELEEPVHVTLTYLILSTCSYCLSFFAAGLRTSSWVTSTR